MNAQIKHAGLLLAVVAAACSGHGTSAILPQVPGQAVPKPSSGPTSQPQSSTAKFVIKVPPKSASSQSIATANHRGSVRPNYVSPASSSISFVVNGNTGSPVTASLTPGSPACPTPSPGNPLICTVIVPAPVGTDTFAITTYDSSNNPLSTATVSATINAVQATQIPVTLNGIVASLVLVVANPSPSPYPTQIPLIVNAYDADGYQIIGPGNFENGPITITDSDTSGNTNIAPATVNAPGQQSLIGYSGGPLPPSGVVAFSASTADGINSSGSPAQLYSQVSYVINKVTNFNGAASIGPQLPSLASDGAVYAGGLDEVTRGFNGSFSTVGITANPLWGASPVMASDGRVWFPSDNNIYAVTPGSALTSASVSGYGPFNASDFACPSCLIHFQTNVVSVSNAIWVGGCWNYCAVGYQGGDFAIWQIDPTSPAGNPNAYAMPDECLPTCGDQISPNRLTVVSGQIWYSSYFGLGVLNVGFQPTGPGASPWGIAPAFSGGNVWFADALGSIGMMAGVPPSASYEEFPVPVLSGDHSCPQEITQGPDGNYWFTDPCMDAIGQATPGGIISEFFLPLGSNPSSITAGPDGNIWFTDSGHRAICVLQLSSITTEARRHRRTGTP